MSLDEKKLKTINLVMHYSCIKKDLRMNRLYGSRDNVKELESVVSEIEKIMHLDNTIVYEKSAKKAVKNLGLTPDTFVRVYGAYYGMCLSTVDINLTEHGIPHELADGGYI